MRVTREMVRRTVGVMTTKSSRAATVRWLCGTVVQPPISTAWASEEPVREHSTGSSSDTADLVDGLGHGLQCCPDSKRLIRSLCSDVADVHTQLPAPRIERGGLLRVQPTRARPVL